MRRARIRLSVEDYADPGSVWHVTLTTNYRQPHLSNAATCANVIDSLSFSCQRGKADLLLYCLMPDHAHVLITVGGDDLIAIMRNVKSWTTRMWAAGDPKARLWQPSFHDRGVRLKSNEVDDVVQYITLNPVRKGFVEEWVDWQWTGGSLVCGS